MLHKKFLSQTLGRLFSCINECIFNSLGFLDSMQYICQLAILSTSQPIAWSVLKSFLTQASIHGMNEVSSMRRAKVIIFFSVDQAIG